VLKVVRYLYQDRRSRTRDHWNAMQIINLCVASFGNAVAAPPTVPFLLSHSSRPLTSSCVTRSFFHILHRDSTKSLFSVTESVFNFAAFIVLFILSLMWKDNSLVRCRPRQSETLRTSCEEYYISYPHSVVRAVLNRLQTVVLRVETLGWWGCSTAAVPRCHGLTQQPCSSLLGR
jgi:hypothetical protein